MRSTFAVRVDSALRALSTLRGLRGAPEVPPLCRETQSLGQQMLNAPVDINGLTHGYLSEGVLENRNHCYTDENNITEYINILIHYRMLIII